nr:peroxidase-related enzyme [Kineosporia mesophila]
MHTQIDERAWVHRAVRVVGADAVRGGDTPLRVFPLPVTWGVHLYLKDESVHPTGSLKHRTARSLILFHLANGDIGPRTTLVDAGAGATVVSQAYFAQLLGLDFVAVVARDTPATDLDLIRRHGGRLHPVDDASAAPGTAQALGHRANWTFLDHRTTSSTMTDWQADDDLPGSIFRQMALEPHPEPAWIVVGARTGSTVASVGRHFRLRRHSTRLAVAAPQGPALARADEPVSGTLVDEIISVPDAQSLAATRILFERTGIRAGSATGTNLTAALRLVARMRAERITGSVVTIVTDDGRRETGTGEKNPYEMDLASARADLAPLTGDDPLSALATVREDVRAPTLALDDLVLRPVEERGLSRTDRLRIALRVAQVNQHTALTSRWATELGSDADPVADPERWSTLGPRTAAILAHAEQMALDPRDLGRDDMRNLTDLGLEAPQVVAVAQVVAYVSYLVRLLQGLEAVGHRPAPAGPLPPFTATLTPDQPEFPVYRWDPWVPPARVPGVEPGADSRTPAQWSPFYLTLLHDPAVLAERTALYNAIMTGSPHQAGTLDRAHRELAALATSLVTGCEYCASVHGRRQIQLSGDQATSVRLARQGPSTLTDPLQQAVIALAAHTATTPPTVGAADVQALREAGLGDDAVRDAVAVAAMFAWANRLMMTLGEAML